VVTQPARPVVEAALHLHHVRHRMDGPRRPAIQGERAAAGLLGLRLQVALLEPERMQRQHVRVQRIGVVPLGQCARRARPQVDRVAAVEVPQVSPLQRQRVAWMVEQPLVPQRTGVVPAPVEHALRGLPVRALARRRGGQQQLGTLQVGARVGHERCLGQAQQEACLHHVRQRPVRIVGDRAVEVGQRRIVERHHAPQRDLDRVACGRHVGAEQVAARVLQGHAAL
jgi:hypothetical protein